MSKRIKFIIENILLYIFYFFDNLIKNKKYIVFSTRAAKDYADNSKILFEKFITEDHSNVFFYTKKKSVLKRIPKNGIYAYSIKGIYILLRSKILIFTHGSGDFYPFNPKKHKNRIFINLFHAIAIKRVGFLKTKKDIDEVNKWDYFVVSSEFESQFIQKQYLLKPEQILIFGQPRNDELIKSDHSHSQNIILYAPTFRDDVMTELFPFKDLDIHKLDYFLGVNNLEIMIRLHINDEKKYKNKELYKGLKNIYFKGSQEIPTVNSILPKITMLISDYSSITLDFLLLDKPIAYIPYDYDFYEETRGFSFDYHTYRAGPIISNQKDLESNLLNPLSHSKTRKKLLDIFHQNQDGNSTELLYHFIQNL